MSGRYRCAAMAVLAGLAALQAACGGPTAQPVAAVDAGAGGVVDAAQGDAAGPADDAADATASSPRIVPLANAWTSTSEGWTLQLDGATRRLQVRRDGEAQPRVTMDLGRWQVGSVPVWDPQYNYNPSHLASNPPEGLVWSAVTAVQRIEDPWPPARPPSAAASHWLLDTAGGKGPRYLLDLQPEPTTGWRAMLRPLDLAAADQWTKDKGSQPVVFVQIAAAAPPDEGYYGVGEMMDTPQHRGKVRALQLEGDLGLDGSSNEGHVRLPLLVGTRGWGLFVQTYRAGIFDVAASEPTQITGVFAGHSLLFHLLLAQAPIDVTARYWRLTGTPALPAPWSLGGLLWRNENKDQAEVLQDAADLRKHDLALSGLWIDRPYDVAVNDFGFHPAQFPDPAQMIGQLHSQGLRLGVWSTPYFDPGYGGKTKSKYHDEAKAKGYYVQGANMWAQLYKWGPPVDFTLPAAGAFFRSRVQQYTALGIEGFKLDYGEDILLGLQQVRLGWQFADGSDERTMHHGYQLGYHAAYASQLKPLQGLQGGGWILARSSAWGDQAQTSMIWPGDLCSGWMNHGECTPDGTCHAGGLPASVAAAISLPTAGFPLFGADTGGYRHGRASKALFLRWLQHTALTAVLQIGGGTDHHPWLAEPVTNKYAGGAPFDAETLEVARTLTRLHARLFPVLWTELMRTQGSDPRGVGPVRALGLQYPHLSGDAGLRAHEADQWLLGPDLLVAPVITPALSRELWVPPGPWVDWFDGTVWDGGEAGKTVQLEVPLAKLPLLVRAGAIVPLLRPTIDTLAPASVEGIDSFANDPGLLWANLRLSGPLAAAVETPLWDGTRLRASQSGQVLALQAEASAAASAVFKQGVVWQLGGVVKAPLAVAAASVALPAVASSAAVSACEGGCWHYQAATQQLTLRAAGWASLQVSL